MAIDRVSRDEIERSTALMRGNPATRIRNARIEPHWFGDGACFWYKRENKAGADYWRVEAATGTRCAAFDHVTAAVSLAATSGRDVSPHALVIERIDAHSLDAIIEDTTYRCALADYRAVRLSPADPHLLIAPDQRQAVYRRDDNLWLRDLRTGAERPLTHDGAPQFGYGMPSDRHGQDKMMRDYAGVTLPPVQTWWSPDARHIVTARLDQRHLAPYPYLECAPQDGSFRPLVQEVRLPLMGEPAGRLDWWVIHVATGAMRPIDFPVDRMIAANNGIDDLKIGWADGGARMLAISGMTDFVGAEVFSVDLASGAVRVVLQDRSSPGNPVVAGGYGRPVARVIRQGREILWWSQRDGWGHLYRYDSASGDLIARVTTGAWLVRDIVAVDEARAEIWFTGMGHEADNPYHRHLYRVGFDGTRLTLMTPEAGDHLIVDPTGSDLVFDGAGPTSVVSPDFAHYVYDVSAIDAPTRTILRRAVDGAEIAVVEHADAAGLFAAGYRPPEEVAAPTADGSAVLHGLVYRPSTYDPARRYPVIDVEYGNPAAAITPRSFAGAAFFKGTAATPAALAELGFIVVVVDARGTPYRGRAFSHAGKDYLATMGLEDHIAFIRAVAARDPALDLARVGIAGQSFGGYTALRALVEFPDVFKVAVAGAPQTAYHNMAAEAVLTASQGPPRYADGTGLAPGRTAVPCNFKALDTASMLDRLTGHALIVAGALDENVYPGTVMQFMDRAIRDDRNVELIWLPNAAHDALFTRYALRRTIDFLLRHLQERVLPDDLPPFPSPER